MGGTKLERKQKRKSKAEDAHVGEQLPPEVVMVAAENAAEPSRKKLKKLKQKQEQLQSPSEGMEAEEEEMEQPVTAPVKKKRKKDKRADDKEAKDAAAAAAADRISDVAIGSSPAESKKDKKKKKHLKKEQEAKEKSGDAADAADGTNSALALNVEDGGRQLVTVSGSGTENPKFKPLTGFDVAGVPEKVLACCKKFDKPSPIQAHSWPFLLAGRDLIGIARTGSGKTLAFGIPGMVHVLKQQQSKSRKPSPLALVLAPTRELTQQIAEVLEEAGGFCGVKIACIYGGTSKGPQKAALKAGATIIVATPGRLQDLLEEGVCSLDLVSFVVLDEADRMLDLGFEPAIRAIIGLTSKSRQTLMFSATWPASVDKLGKEFMQDSNKIVKVTVGSEDLAANHDVTQIVEVLDDRDRMRRLETLLQQYHKSRKNRVIVFVLYKKEAVRVESHLQQRGWKVTAVHGDKGQSDRTRAVQSFRDGTFPLLVATDVAARGLDIPDVEYVINFSFPLTVEDYVHRIGRTGRAGKKGVAHTFFTLVDKARAGELVNVLNEAGQEVPPDLLKFGTHVKKKESALYGAHFKEIGATAKQATKITFDNSDEE